MKMNEEKIIPLNDVEIELLTEIYHKFEGIPSGRMMQLLICLVDKTARDYSDDLKNLYLTISHHFSDLAHKLEE